MTSLVGRKGQVVIAKEIRDRLGIEPGWVAVQRMVEGHVEIHFLPPPPFLERLAAAQDQAGDN